MVKLGKFQPDKHQLVGEPEAKVTLIPWAANWRELRQNLPSGRGKEQPRIR